MNYSHDSKKHLVQKINALEKANKSYSLEIAVSKYINIFNDLEFKKY